MATISHGWLVTALLLRGATAAFDVAAVPCTSSRCGSGRRRAAAVAKVADGQALGEMLRPNFALLDQTVGDDKPLIYLDSAATSQKPASVLDAMRHHLERDNANVHRGAHSLSQRSTASYEAARAKVAAFVGAADPREIVFTRGATEAINLVAASWGATLQAGDEIILSVLEHHSNLVPWQLLAEERGVVLKYAQLSADEQLDVDHLASLITPRTKVRPELP